MNQLLLVQGRSQELRLFPHIIEVGTIKNTSIDLNAFPIASVAGVKFFFILDGRFQWSINDQENIFYPGDVALILPGQGIGNCNCVLEIGSFSMLHIEASLSADQISLEEWSSLSDNEMIAISRILLLNTPLIINKCNEAGKILKCIQQEIFSQEVGYAAKVNHHIDDLIITLTRQLTRQNNPGRDFPKSFMKLEEALRQDLSHQWTVDQMAALVGLGNTLFNEKVKSHSGFTPLNYLINIRISEAIKLLKKSDISITDIALDTGFYSSQHFSTTFKKFTGFTPADFRKNNSYHK